MLGLGFAIQRLRPFSDETLAQVSHLVAYILLPFFLFFTTAQSGTVQSLRAAPQLVALGIGISLFNFGLATLFLRPCHVARTQRSAFRFASMLANTAFVGIPVCDALFGSVGVLYGVLYDFGISLVALTVGIWDLAGGGRANLRPIFFNPLLWGVAAGFAWALMGWDLPELVSRPFSALGDATLPLALLVTGSRLGNMRSPGLRWARQLGGLILLRLLISSLIAGIVLALIGWRSMTAQVAVLQNAMPVGLTTAIYAGAYGGDAEFAATATFWTTIIAVLSLPLITMLVLYCL